MKRLSHSLLAAGLFATCVAVAACSKVFPLIHGEFRFTASVSKVNTKTSYSGEGASQGGVLTNERIDWTFGDFIRIYSPEAAIPEDENVHFADYRVIEHPSFPGGIDSANPLVSYARIESASGQGLFNTSEQTYQFYAVYPSPATSGMPAGAAFQDGDLTGVIPSAQTISRRNSDSYVYLPDMRLAYMTATQSMTLTEDGFDVPLSFYPKFSSFEFTVSSGEYNSVTLRSMSLTSTTGYLTGTFNIAQGDFGPVEAGISDADVTGGGREISVDFGSSGITVIKDHPVSICVIALAQSVGGLKVTFTGDEIGARSLALKKSDGSDITFAPWRKHRILGLSFPTVADAVLIDPIIWDGEYLSDAFGDVIAWDRSASVDAAIPGGDSINWMEERGLCGPFGGLYMTKGYLEQTAEDVYKLTGNDQLEILKYYQNGDPFENPGLPRYYHNFHWGSYYSLGPDELISGYTIPTIEQYETIIGTGTPVRDGATVNGLAEKHFAAVAIDLTSTEYESYGLSGNNTINGLLLFPDGAIISCPELTAFDAPQSLNTISFSSYEALCSGTGRCAFLPCAGKMYLDVGWSDPMGYYLTQSQSDETWSSHRWVIYFSVGGTESEISRFDTGGSPQFCPVRMVMDFN